MRSSVVSASGLGSFMNPGIPEGVFMETPLRFHLPQFRGPRRHRLKAGRDWKMSMLSVAEVGRLFDEDTRKAIANGLCVSCRAAKLLCGKPRCPILVKYDSMMKTQPLIDDTALDGSSPPGVFVGRFGYPKVFVGPLIPPVHGDTEILDTPEAWIGRTLEEIVGFRAHGDRRMHRPHVLEVDGGGLDGELPPRDALARAAAVEGARVLPTRRRR